MFTYISSDKICGKDKRKQLRLLPEKLSRAACGFLLARGISGGALNVRWSMAALMGASRGNVYGVLLFAVGCALVWVVRCSFGARGNAVVNGFVFATCVLWQALGREGGGELAVLADSAAVLAALLLADRHRTGAIQLLTLALMIPLGLTVPITTDTHLALRATALCGGIASAGMCGAALEQMADSNSQSGGAWLVAGIALGLL